MRRLHATIPLALAAVLLLAACGTPAGSPAGGPAAAKSRPDWMVGTWELSYDPDGAPQDRMVFRADGTVTNQFPGEPDVDGEYRAAGDRVMVTLNEGDRTRTTEMRLDEATGKLLFTSDSTGSTAEYSRVEE